MANLNASPAPRQAESATCPADPYGCPLCADVEATRLALSLGLASGDLGDLVFLPWDPEMGGAIHDLNWPIDDDLELANAENDREFRLEQSRREWEELTRSESYVEWCDDLEATEEQERRDTFAERYFLGPLDEPSADAWYRADRDDDEHQCGCRGF